MLVAKIFFMRCHSQLNLKTIIALLTTGVNYPNLDNYKNLARCARYIRATMDMPLKIHVCELDLIQP